MSHPKRQEFKTLLRSYYSGNDSDSAKTSATIGAKEGDPLDVDSKQFDAKLYFKNLIKTKNLPELIKINNDLDKAVKQLDNNMKTLVYDNYNKFISAADTIRKMRNNVEQLEEEMIQLDVMIEQIHGAAQQITTTLSTKREKIEQLSGVHRLLQKMQFLVELPQRLEQALQLEAYSQATRYWTKAEHVLTKYAHMPSFSNIHTQCRLIVERLKTLIKEKLNNKEIPPSEVSDYVGLLIDLNESPSSLRAEYIDNRCAALLAKLTPFRGLTLPSNVESVGQSVAGALASSPQSSTASEVQPWYGETTLPLIEKFVLEWLRTECERSEWSQVLVRVGRTLFPEFIEFVTTFASLFIRRESNPNERTIALKQFAAASRSVFAAHFELCRTLLASAPNALHVLAALQTQNAIFTQVQTDLTKLLEETTGDGAQQISVKDVASTVLLALNIPDVAYNFTLSILTLHLEHDFAQAHSEIDTLTRRLNDERVVWFDDGTLSATVAQIQATIQHVLNRLKPFFVCVKRGQFLHNVCMPLVTKVGVKVQQLFLTALATKLTDSTERKDAHPSHTLLLFSRLFVDLKKVLSHIESQLALLLSLVNQPKLNDFGFNVSDLQRLLHEAAQNQLAQYVRVQGQKLGAMIWKALDTPNWLKRHEPRGVELVMELVVDEILTIQRIVSRVYGTPLESERSSRTAGTHSTANAKATSSSLLVDATNTSDKQRLVSRSSAVSTSREFTRAAAPRSHLPLSDIDQLFAKKVQYFGPVSFSVAYIVTSIIKICLKNYLESVRLQTFGTHGFQQIQVDTHFIRLNFAEIVDDVTVLDGILDQILANAADRCLDPKLMDFQIVQKICDERLAKRQQTDSDAPSLPLPSSNSNNNNPTRSVDTTVANDTSDRKNLPLISSSNDANG